MASFIWSILGANVTNIAMFLSIALSLLKEMSN
jgi:hypothetical protein